MKNITPPHWLVKARFGGFIYYMIVGSRKYVIWYKMEEDKIQKKRRERK